MLDLGIGNRVVTTGMPGVTTTDPLHRQPQTFHAAVRFNSFGRVLRTGWGIATVVAEQRAEQVSVCLNQYYQESAHCLMMLFQC